ncbi:uncharacterized protein Z520_08604 [Fonsecaea multimorphosa CBS 102226]|uniref:Trichothecene 3-O-acetyltransferase-like N-terminal domain-containing protein n=1 Tax=Fonsecaea multimorphosa CBS 102226 TaxID=1442371 RepID=A0A0D2JY75_9EURO|nr:uncharacterized protein Z520_08604 [Fonsecaea multimorphosa CBS 102226]KIX95484.1 hypothetical protein Z520_08604 [Fonsecaea multimorphosa CBS 102226]OAL21330.1 hypothetical protein AYO22_08053 [Fonsecaea multimorphosa]
MEELADHLDIFGQQEGLYKLYTQLCLCFRMSDGSSQSDIIGTLTQGLERLAASFPWVAGQVLREDAGDGTRNLYKIKPFEKTPRLVVKDFRDGSSTLSMDVLRQANFPFSMLDESIIAPVNTLAAGTDGPAPVFLVQANFVTGGLLLTFVTQHNTMDMTGMARIMYLLSKACRNEPFTAEEISTGNLDRRDLIPLLDESYRPGPELSYQIEKPPAHQDASNAADGESEQSQPQSPKCSWAYFIFSAASLKSLKSLAMQSLTGNIAYVSTDDVLSAFIWVSVTRARRPRLDSTREVTFARAIDPRRYLGIPATYPGLVQNMTYTTCPLEGLLDAHLGSIASKLREAVDPSTSNLAYATRALATWLHRAPPEDNNKVNVTATLDLSADIMLSSWSKYDYCYDLDFGLGLGKPEAVRRPQFVPVESLFYLMPKRQDGEIAAALCLREEDLDRLRKDEEFMKYAVYVG